jgi:hypothetical protein
MLIRMSDLWIPKAGKATGITSADSPIQIHTLWPALQHPAVLAREENVSSVFTRLYEHMLDQD